MLTRLEIKNYRCFPHLDVELRPLTVLIGANNTGKSAFLDAFRALHKKDLTEFDRWRLQKEAALEIQSQSADKQFLVKSMVAQSGEFSFVRPNPLNEVAYFQLPSSGIACRHKGFPDSNNELPLNERGDELSALLDFMLRNDRKRFDGVVQTLRDLVPGFEDLLVPTPDPTTRHIKAVLDNGLHLPGESLSVGLRHLIFFVTLAHHPRAPEVILIEEPELGVHPKRLGDILKLLRSISRGEFCDHPSQVILTTHSPFLLDHVDLDQDQLLIFQREDEVEGARTAVPADRDRLKIFLDEFMLGEVWFNESEEGLIKQP